MRQGKGWSLKKILINAKSDITNSTTGSYQMPIYANLSLSNFLWLTYYDRGEQNKFFGPRSSLMSNRGHYKKLTQTNTKSNCRYNFFFTIQIIFSSNTQSK